MHLLLDNAIIEKEGNLCKNSFLLPQSLPLGKRLPLPIALCFELGQLIQDFKSRRADDMKSSVLAARMRLLKETEEGVSKMCEIMEEYCKKREFEGKIQTVREMIKAGLTTLSAVKESGLYTDKEIAAISAQQ